jgi:hypothetical protein
MIAENRLTFFICPANRRAFMPTPGPLPHWRNGHA